MIFGHAPVIFPAVLGREISYGPHFYGHVGLLHASLGVRVLADLAGLIVLRRWGGMLNAVALLLFLGVTVVALRKGRVESDQTKVSIPKPG
jgi:branched-subunit amino acid permease